MPWGLTRFHHSGQSHFVTFCCYHRHRLLTTDASRRIFESALERVRRKFRLFVYGYVIMPEHVHLLLSEPKEILGGDVHTSGGPLKPSFGLSGNAHETLADALKSLKQGVARRLIGDAEHFWQKRYYDFNIRDYPQFLEKLRYIHRNPGARSSPLLACWGRGPQRARFWLAGVEAGEGWAVRTSGGLGVEQFSPLRNRL